MNFTRLVPLAVVGCGLAFNPALHAQAASPAPWAPDKQFSADEVITTKKGMTIDSKMYVDNGNIRTDMDGHGMTMESIVRLDEKKMYMVMVDQKMVMEMPLTDAKAREMSAATGGGDATFTLVGPDTVNGTPSLKYKMTTAKDPKIFFWWINAATRAPVKMAAEDGSFTVIWNNYKAGPQDAALFVPPAGFNVMQMPAGLGMPGGRTSDGSAPAGP